MDNNFINVGQLQLSGNNLTGLDLISTQPQTTAATPSIGWFYDNLFLAWSRLGNHKLNIAISYDREQSFVGVFTNVDYTTAQAPILGSDRTNSISVLWTDAKYGPDHVRSRGGELRKTVERAGKAAGGEHPGREQLAWPGRRHELRDTSDRLGKDSMTIAGSISSAFREASPPANIPRARPAPIRPP